MLKKKVIASSISNLTDARYFAAWGVYGVGFDLDLNSPDHISAEALLAFREWISGPISIGEFSGVQEKEEIEEIIKTLNLDAIQLGPFAPEEWSFDVPVYQVLLTEQDRSFHNAQAIIIRSENPSFSWHKEKDKITALMKIMPAYLDLPLSHEEIVPIINELDFEGLILRGGDEEKVGFKSYDEVDEIMESLEE
jgi:phosphoribosylanthranilate isomerase